MLELPLTLVWSRVGQESAMLIASLRDVIRNQAAEIEKLQSKLKAVSTASSEVRPSASSHLPC